MNSKLLELEAKKRLQVESERKTLSTRKQQIGWKKERGSTRELRRERKRTTNQVSRSQIGKSDVRGLTNV
jgi:hypothetical protein